MTQAFVFQTLALYTLYSDRDDASLRASLSSCLVFVPKRSAGAQAWL